MPPRRGILFPQTKKQMEIADCRLKLGNDVNSIVNKFDVTPAEVQVLQQIHGHGSVSHIRIKGVDINGKCQQKRSHSFELSRLRELYQGDPAAQTIDENGFHGGSVNQFHPSQARVVDMLFPGLNPQIPIAFSEIMPVKPVDPVDEDPVARYVSSPVAEEGASETNEEPEKPKSRRGRPPKSEPIE
jgi:hypothetical protein